MAIPFKGCDTHTQKVCTSCPCFCLLAIGLAFAIPLMRETFKAYVFFLFLNGAHTE